MFIWRPSWRRQLGSRYWFASDTKLPVFGHSPYIERDIVELCTFRTSVNITIFICTWDKLILYARLLTVTWTPTLHCNVARLLMSMEKDNVSREDHIPRLIPPHWYCNFLMDAAIDRWHDRLQKVTFPVTTRQKCSTESVQEIIWSPISWYTNVNRSTYGKTTNLEPVAGLLERESCFKELGKTCQCANG